MVSLFISGSEIEIVIVFERRASAILFNLLRTLPEHGSVLLPANVCPVLPLVCREAGRSFQLIDIEPRSLAIDPIACRSAVTEQAEVAAVLYVRPYGDERAPSELFSELKRQRADLLLIDDRCLCVPDLSATSPAAGADVSLFSTGYGKQLDLGHGGFAVLAEDVTYRQRWRSFSGAHLDPVERLLYEAAPCHRDPFSAVSNHWLDLRRPTASWSAYAGEVRRRLGPAVQRREALNKIYRQTIPARHCLPDPFQSWRFNLLCPQPEELLARLHAVGLFASRHWTSLGGSFGCGSFPVADRLATRIVNLFNDHHVDAEKVDRTARLAAEILGDAS